MPFEEQTLMTSRITKALAFAACTFALASPALAQGGGPSGMHLNSGQWAVDGSIGFAVPVGDYGTGLSTGLDLMGAVEYRPPTTGPFSFRGEIGYSTFGYSVGGANSDILRFDIDGLYDFPMSGTPLVIYGLAGLGLYHVSFSYSSLCDAGPYCSASTTGVGINFGAGVRYPVNPIQLFFELRYHVALINGDAPYFPFQFGVRYLLPR
jgi:hypothetical protein